MRSIPNRRSGRTDSGTIDTRLVKNYLLRMIDSSRNILRRICRTGKTGTATMLVLAIAASTGQALAQSATPPAEAPPEAIITERTYQQKLLRLSEVLGAMHHLRGICGAREGQLWREQMIRMLDAEAPSPTRRAELVRNFNKGYRFHQQSFRTCTDSASIQAQKFAAEGRQLSQSLALERANF